MFPAASQTHHPSPVKVETAEITLDWVVEMHADFKSSPCIETSMQMTLKQNTYFISNVKPEDRGIKYKKIGVDWIDNMLTLFEKHKWLETSMLTAYKENAFYLLDKRVV